MTEPLPQVLFENKQVVAIRLKNIGTMQLEKGSYRELTSSERGTTVFVGKLSEEACYARDLNPGTNICGPEGLVELVYYADPESTE